MFGRGNVFQRECLSISQFSNVVLKCFSEVMFINFQFSNVVLKCSSEVMSEEPHFPAQATARVIVMVEKMPERSKKNLKDITGAKKYERQASKT